MKISQVNDADEKRAITEKILMRLPDWFGIPESTTEYVKKSADLPMLAVYEGDEVVGFLSLQKTSTFAYDVYVMGILEEHHRKGIGRAMIDEAKRLAFDDGAEYLHVKTLDGSNPDEHYARTRRFYESVGFRPLECFPLLWDESNPCLLMVMKL